MNDFDEFIQKLDLLGEEEVSRNFSQGVYANKHKEWAQDWIAKIEASREKSRAEKSLALSQQQNDIARSSLEVARSAKTISIVAMILSAAVAVAVAVIQIVKQ